MAHSSKEYMKDYMKRYRQTIKELASVEGHRRLTTKAFLRDEIVTLIREKYPDLCNQDLYELIIEYLYPTIEQEFPNLDEFERDMILNVHLLYYYRTGQVRDVLLGLKHPSLMPTILEKLGESEKKNE
jgi:hypothetical protein